MPLTTTARAIDARGLVVAPGFIDLHTHSDIPLLVDGTAQSKVRQGVTTEVLGESTSVAPRDGLAGDAGRDFAAEADGGTVAIDWTTFSQYFSRLERQGISMNVIAHVAADQVRRVVMGYDSRSATAAELDGMKTLVARSMREGAARRTGSTRGYRLPRSRNCAATLIRPTPK